MPWISLIASVSYTLRDPRAPEPIPRESDPYEKALEMYATSCMQAAIFQPDPKEAARFFGDAIKAQWDLVELGIRRTLEAYQPHPRRTQ